MDNIIQIAVTTHGILLLNMDNNLYGYGYNYNNQLGIYNQKSTSISVLTLIDTNVLQISTGIADHVLIIKKEKNIL